jgi:hypothetical protein
VLSVGVECRDELRALLEREVEPGLQRSALPEIDGMADHLGARPGGEIGRMVLGPVVHHHHAVAGTGHVGDDVGDHLRLVIGGDDDPHVLGRWLHGGPAPRMTRSCRGPEPPARRINASGRQ